jgi:dolichyl-phosphate beta-glucosyltransferase
LFTDADNATSIDHVERMLPFIEEGYDVVIGSLAVQGAKVLAGGAEPLWRVVLGKLGNLWIQAWAVPGIWDTQRGFKVFTKRAAERIFSHMSVFGWGFDVEVLALARGQKFRIREVPVVWRNDPDSKVNVWAYPKVLMDTVKVGLRRIAGMYRGNLGR